MICNMKCFINKKYYFLLLILLFAGGLPAKSSNLDKTKPEDIIRLASYNIRTKGDKGDKAWEVRLNALVDVVRRNKFDMFAIQEGRTSQLKDMMILNEFSYIGRDRDGDNKGEHCAIFYKKDRFKVLKHGDFWYSETPDIPSYGWGARCRRICTWGYFKDLRSGKKFYVFNSHTDHEATEARRQSSFMLLEQVRKIAKGKPTFCTGDFNATPDEEPIQLLLKDSLLLDSYKCTLTPPKGPSGSFYAYDKTGNIAKRIDFIFVTPKIKVLSYHTIDDDIKYNKYYILKCDVSKFFASINHDILKEKLEKRIKDREALKIVFDIIDSNDKGLYIGSMANQVLAIFYLNDLDKFIKEELKIKYYVRYQDDMLLFHKSKKYLQYCFKEIEKFLEKEKLKLNSKSRIYKNTNNYTFLGRNPKGKYVRYRNVRRKFKAKRYLYEINKIDLYSLCCSLNSYRDVIKDEHRIIPNVHQNKN